MPDVGVLTARADLAGRISLAYLQVRLALRRSSLPEIVAGAPRGNRPRQDPRRLGRAVSRLLRVGGDAHMRCIHRALVLHRLLAAQGDVAEVVIGLPDGPTDERAHAWVELAGRDLGPAPGRSGHLPMARYS